MAHGLLQPPQCVAFVFTSTQLPPHIVEHTHAPDWQTYPGPFEVTHETSAAGFSSV
jgi:hypothetical protein